MITYAICSWETQNNVRRLNQDLTNSPHLIYHDLIHKQKQYNYLAYIKIT